MEEPEQVALCLEVKTCRRCQKQKPLTDFYRDSKRPDSLMASCKTCVDEKKNTWKVANQERTVEYHRRSYQRNLEVIKERNQRRRAERLETTKRCNRCLRFKPYVEFSGDKTSPDGRTYACKPCRKEIKAQATPSLHGRRNEALRKYGITHDDYERMLAEQSGCCAVCKSTDPGGKPHFAVDHDHRTGKNRALLCTHCNAALGQVDDSPELLEALAAYLRRHQATLSPV